MSELTRPEFDKYLKDNGCQFYEDEGHGDITLYIQDPDVYYLKEQGDMTITEYVKELEKITFRDLKWARRRCTHNLLDYNIEMLDHSGLYSCVRVFVEDERVRRYDMGSLNSFDDLALADWISDLQ